MQTRISFSVLIVLMVIDIKFQMKDNYIHIEDRSNDFWIFLIIPQ